MLERSALGERELEGREFIPYLRHVDDHVIALRGRSLMTMLAVDGFAFETADTRDINGLHARLNTLWRNIGDHRLAVYEGLPSGQRALLWLDGADHMTFGGNAEQRIGARRGLFHRDPAVAEREPAQHALVAEVTSLWWRSRLLGDAAATNALRAPPGLGPNDRWRSD